jgi:hypothetical protein
LFQFLLGFQVHDDQAVVVFVGIRVRAAGNFGDPDGGLLVAGVVDQGQVAFVHGSHVLECRGVGDAVPGGLLVLDQLVPGVGAGFCFQEPTRHCAIIVPRVD